MSNNSAEHWFYHEGSDVYTVLTWEDAEACPEPLDHICPVYTGYIEEAKVAHWFLRNGQPLPDMRSTGGRKVDIKKAVDMDSQPSAADLLAWENEGSWGKINIHPGNVSAEVFTNDDQTAAVIMTYPIPVTPGEPLQVEAEGFSRTCPLRFRSWMSFWEYITGIRPDAAMTNTVTYQGQTYETHDIMSSALEEIQASLLTVEEYYNIRRAIMGPVNTWTEDKERLANSLLLFTKREGVPHR